MGNPRRSQTVEKAPLRQILCRSLPEFRRLRATEENKVGAYTIQVQQCKKEVDS